jgi:hypothetical protein
MKFSSLLGQDKKMLPLNTGDCLIEVTSWAGLTIYFVVFLRNMTSPMLKGLNYYHSLK